MSSHGRSGGALIRPQHRNLISNKNHNCNGYDTVYRDSAEAALQFLAEGANIDLIFSDIVMPGTIDGVGLASEVRVRYPNLQVILTTGYSDAARATPPDLRILHKPFNTNALRNLLQETMGSRLASE